ncbi:MAG: DNA-deoxyinosine glycosylase [Spirochaetia bacterium]|nr:DNA-deoxyinosine glycosylase [Spirochaetia bacterium]
MAAEGDSAEMIYGFPPIIGEQPRVLILGSMPGVKSLELGQYYGHQQNHFWRIMSELLGRPMPGGYAGRTAMLCEAGIAVWDVFDSCRREGSLDQSIREAIPNDVPGLLRKYPSIRLVVFNGRKAEQGFYRAVKELYSEAVNAADFSKKSKLSKLTELLELPELREREFRRLPSTSPIPTRRHKRWQDKLDEWRIILKYLDG